MSAETAEQPSHNLVEIQSQLAHGVGISPVNGQPIKGRWKPGESGNPAGRKSIGASIRDWMTTLDGTEHAELERLAKSRKEPISKILAAQALLRAATSADVADFDDVIAGKMTLKDAQAKGLPTKAIKRAKANAAGGVDIELRADQREDLALIIDHTDGKAIQRTQTDAPPMLAVQISVPGLNIAELIPPADVPTLADGSDNV